MKTYIVDSFTDAPFKGNPAGVCLLEGDLSEDTMLLIAQELGFSETAFVERHQAEGEYSIRFFSPKMEIPLCGHATLASAKVIFEETSLDVINFTNIQGIELSIRKLADEIIMEFPVYYTIPEAFPTEIRSALGIREVINSEYNTETNILLLEIENTSHLRDLNPDFSALVQATDKYNGILVTAKSTDDEYDFHSRYFWPWSGTNEDPVTGGTHTFLTPYWSKRLGKNKMKSFQSSQRTGFMEVELRKDDKLIIKSQAQIVFKGHLMAI